MPSLGSTHCVSTTQTSTPTMIHIHSGMIAAPQAIFIILWKRVVPYLHHSPHTTSTVVCVIAEHVSRRRSSHALP